jgi:hypothetical protein
LFGIKVRIFVFTPRFGPRSTTLSREPAERLPTGVNGAKTVDDDLSSMDRQQVIAIIFAVLMVGSMVVYGASAFF